MLARDKQVRKAAYPTPLSGSLSQSEPGVYVAESSSGQSVFIRYLTRTVDEFGSYLRTVAEVTPSLQ